MEPYRVYIGVVGLIVFGGAAAGMSWLWVKSLVSRRWPTASGRIISMQLDLNPHNRLQGRVSVSYEYQVQGQLLCGTRVRFGDWLIYSAFAARSIAARYPQGKGVTVHYNPRKPEDATLEPAVTTILVMWLGIAIFAAATIGVVFWRGA
jgi:hypothetical protein